MDKREIYLDLKKFEKIEVRRNADLEAVVDVLDVNANRTCLRYQTKYGSQIHVLKRGEYLKFKELGVYNFGNRSRGNRTHVRVELYCGRDIVRR